MYLRTNLAQKVDLLQVNSDSNLTVAESNNLKHRATQDQGLWLR